MKQPPKTNFEVIRDEGRLLMEYVRGSSCYELTTPDSDVDTGGIYIAKPEEVLGMIGYKPQVSDERHDNTWYEIGNFVELLMKSNPTVMEALFVPDDKIIGELHPFMKELRDNRYLMLSKDIYWPFYGYAKSQIEKARGLNKKIVNPIVKRLGALDFTYTFYKQGSTKIHNWLEKRGLRERFCGLNNVPNMHDVYGLYYDFGQHASEVENWEDDELFLRYVYSIIYKLPPENLDLLEDFDDKEKEEIRRWVNEQKYIGYRGLVDEKDNTTQLRLSSIDDSKDRPICHICYNQTGFQKHCIDYKNYKTWERERNPKRYESNLDKNYDSKNMMHCFRLIHMAKEILRGEGFNLVRTWDHDFLMSVRNHEHEYDELISMLEQETKEMDEIYKRSSLPEHIDKERVNEILISIRKKQMEGLK